MKVVFDFDDVLFDARAFKEKMFALLAGKGYAHVESVYSSMRSDAEPFSLDRLLERLVLDGSHDEREGLYQEVLGACFGKANQELMKIIERIGKENCIILTQGVEKFQLEKIRRSVGIGHVGRIVVVPSGKGEAIEEICREFGDEDVIFVDDKEKFFRDINFEHCRNLKTVLYNRNGLDNLLAEVEDSLFRESERRIPGELSEPTFKPKKEFSEPSKMQ